MTVRRGFTLIETLTVLAIIALLLGLIIPAVMYARESARRAQCQNNLAQFGRALHGYQSLWGKFPPAIKVTPGESYGLNNYPPHVYLLPHVEQGALFSRINIGSDAAFASHEPPWGPREAVATVPVYVCPSDPVPGAEGSGGNSYRVCLGPAPFRFDEPTTPQIEGGSGAFAVLEELGPSDFADGLSNTVAMSEKRKSDGGAFDPETDFWFTGLVHVSEKLPTNEMVAVCASLDREPAAFGSYAGASWFYGGFQHTFYNHTVPPNAAVPDCDFSDKGAGGNDGVYKASSHHRGGVNVLLMDGAVHFVADGIDLAVWRAAATRAGGEPSAF